MVGRVGFSRVGPGQVCAQPRTDPTPSSGKSEDLLSTELVIRSFRIELWTSGVGFNWNREGGGARRILSVTSDFL